MRESSKAALGGIIAALAVVVMLITYFSPLLVYTAPPFAGILLIVIVNEIGYRWAFGTYIAISLLSVFLIADKESAVYFTMFFGYYPILKLLMDSKLHSRVLLAVLKILLFNLSIGASVAVCVFLFHIPYDNLMEKGWGLAAVFLVMLNVLLYVYDRLIAALQTLYSNKIGVRIRRIFRH